MRIVTPVVLVCGAALLLWTLNGCSTDQPGVTNTLGTYNATVQGSPDKVTKAAQETAEDFKLTNIVVNSTKVDGYVSARNAHGGEVSISVDQAGDNVSSVRVHSTADGPGGMEIIQKIQEHMKSWL